jgi:SEC-C motif-containing protein
VKTKQKAGVNPCPCGAGDYAQCCGRFIEAGLQPDSAEQLMRSRYSAYVLRNEEYLAATWHPNTRPAGPMAQDEAVKWLGLDVRRHVPAGDTSIVEFVARYRVDGRAQRMHEVSNFMRENGKWLYVDGSFPEDKKQ